jgi:predicted DNA-binding transcriptional regulator AlpA
MNALRPAELPGWPGGMPADLAAAYVGLGESSMKALVGQRLFPRPIKLSAGRIGWRKSDLDRWLEAGGVDGWTESTATVTAETADPWMTR